MMVCVLDIESKLIMSISWGNKLIHSIRMCRDTVYDKILSNIENACIIRSDGLLARDRFKEDGIIRGDNNYISF